MTTELVQEPVIETAYTGDTPWSAHGVRLDNVRTAAEAVQAAHLDWTVEGKEIYSDGKVIPGYQAIQRQDNGEFLAVMSERYEIFQNENSWTWMDTVLKDTSAEYHTAGSLKGGRVVFILAKMDETHEIVKDDPVEKYLLLTTSHDGSISLGMHVTPIRFKCGNTMTAAINAGLQYVSIKHTASIHRRLEQASKALAAGETYFNGMISTMRSLADTSMSDQAMAEFTKAVLRINPNKDGKINSQTELAEREINELFTMGRGQDNPLVRGTAWAAMNAVTEYIDYRSRVQKLRGASQGSFQAQDRRLHRSWFGRGQNTRNRAMSLLQEYQIVGREAFAPVLMRV